MKDEQYKWSREHHSIFENFAVGLQQFWRTGNKIEHSSKMFQVSLDKQRDALEKQGLHMTYEMVPNGHFAKDAVKMGWKDGVYSNDIECRTCSMVRRIYKGKEQVYKEKQNVNIYVTITDALKKERMADKQRNCPNCGAISTIAQLQAGCPYCKTQFRMSDLFPVVTNYYMVKEISGTEKEIRGRVLKVCIPAAIVGAIGMLGSNLIQGVGDATIGAYLWWVIGGMIFGGIMGYILWAFATIGGALWEAGKVIPIMFSVFGSRKRFVNTVKRYSPEFSYEFFVDKVVAILRQLLAEEKMEDNPYYVGSPTNIDAPEIIEYAFRGPVALKSCRMDGSQCNVVVDVYMTDYYWKKEHIKKRDDIFRVSLTKDLSKKINYGFSLSAIKCKSCGGSFDATVTKTCPYCENEYQLSDDDWIVTMVKKR